MECDFDINDVDFDEEMTSQDSEEPVVVRYFYTTCIWYAVAWDTRFLLDLVQSCKTILTSLLDFHNYKTTELHKAWR